MRTPRFVYYIYHHKFTLYVIIEQIPPTTKDPALPSPITTLAQLTSQHAALYAPVAAANAAVAAQRRRSRAAARLVSP